MIGKSAIRADMLARRRRLASEEQVSHGRAIQDAFLGLESYALAASIALYLPINGEVPTYEVLAHAQSARKAIYLPALEGQDIVLREYSDHAGLKIGKFGVLEPAVGSRTIDPASIDIIIVPGVVFDLAGNRGGYGKGYYDRLLKSCCQSSSLVGFCYEFQLVDAIAVESHDVKMNMVITERRVISSC